MATKRRLGLRNMRPIQDPTGELRGRYLLALDEGWMCWNDIFQGAAGCVHGWWGMDRDVEFPKPDEPIDPPT